VNGSKLLLVINQGRSGLSEVEITQELRTRNQIDMKYRGALMRILAVKEAIIHNLCPP
jgi:hypothetical protein